MKIDVTTEEVRALWNEGGGGMMEIKKKLMKEKMAEAIEVAQTVDDLREVLRAMLPYL